eukprot:COSAG02_NODE_22891_length_736_cov_1.788069_1_plen_40_part_10
MCLLVVLPIVPGTALTPHNQTAARNWDGPGHPCGTKAAPI